VPLVRCAGHSGKAERGQARMIRMFNSSRNCRIAAVT
jgi:hypothetical protein